MTGFDESVVEEAALDYLRDIGYSTQFGPNLAPGGVAQERAAWDEVYLLDRLRAAGRRLNPAHRDLVDEAIKRLQRAESQAAVAENYRVHRLLVDGAPVEYRGDDGQVRTANIRLIDFDEPASNDWLAVNQFTVVQEKNRRPDVVVFVNGIPLGLLELKNPADEPAHLRNAWNQVQT